MPIYNVGDKVTFRRDTLDSLVKTGTIVEVFEDGVYNVKDAERNVLWCHVPEKSLILIKGEVDENA